MAKNKVSEWSAVPANNTDIGGIDIAEGCAPSGINNAIREMMAQLKDQQSGTDADSFTVGGNLIVNGTATGVTPTSSDDSTKFATTEWVQDKVGTLGTMSTQNANAVAITGGTITGLSSALPVASGGTGSTTSTGSGAVVLASSPTLTTPALGTPSSIDLTNATGTANSLNAGLGVNQTYQNVFGSRSNGVTYANSTGKPIFVSVYGGGAAVMYAFVDGIVVQTSAFSITSTNTNVAFIVPNGSTYRVTATNGINAWTELR